MQSKITLAIVATGFLMSIGVNAIASDDRYEYDNRDYSEYRDDFRDSDRSRHMERAEYRDTDNERFEEKREYSNDRDWDRKGDRDDWKRKSDRDDVDRQFDGRM